MARVLTAAQAAYEKALGAIEGTTHRRYLEAVYHNLVQVNLALGDWLQAERFHQAGLPLVELNPEREAPRFNFLKGRLLESGSPPNFEQAEVFYEQSIGADEASGALVLAAQTRFFLAQMLAQKKRLSATVLCLQKFGASFMIGISPSGNKSAKRRWRPWRIKDKGLPLLQHLARTT